MRQASAVRPVCRRPTAELAKLNTGPPAPGKECVRRIPLPGGFMADEADLAFDSEQRHLSHALAAQRQRGSVLRPIGCCHYCGNDEAIEQRLFCDSDCASDWDYQDTLRRKLGLPSTPWLRPATPSPAYASA